MFPHTLCIIKGLLNQAINAHTHTHCPHLLGFVSMVTCVCSPQMQLVTLMAVRYGGENKAALKRLIISSVCLQVHLKGQGEKLALLILVLILTEMTLSSPSHQCRCDDGEVLVFSDTICLLPHRDAGVHRLVCVDAPLPKHSGILPIIPLSLTH